MQEELRQGTGQPGQRPSVTQPRTTPRAALDSAVAEVAAQRRNFARMPPAEKAHLLEAIAPLVVKVGRGWVEAGCRAKGLSADSPLGGEEWFAGPLITARNARLLAVSLRQIAERGRPSLGRSSKVRPDGRLMVEVFPAGGLDPTIYRGFSCVALLESGLDEQGARERQASFYQKRDPEGAVALVLGAGNVASIPASDVLQKLFVEGQVCVLKMNPVNAWVGPLLEQAFAPLIERQFLRVVYGGGEVGAHLCAHPGIDEIHITGSNLTHDRIVWGPPGPDQDERRRANDPLLKKRITSELGNVSPVMIVPGTYTEEELWFQVRNLVTMVTNNASFNCNAAKILVTARGWTQRAHFLELLARAFSQVPLRHAYYPGAHDRYEQLVGQRTDVERFGRPESDELAWTLISNLDPKSENEALYRTEPFCGILSHVELEAPDPSAFLQRATAFCNDRLWGTLNAAIIIDPRTEADPDGARALERAILELRYGTVAVNHWPAVVFAAVSPAWGGAPGATLANVESGIGWVHNTFMLEGIEKSVLRGPIVMSPKPAWFYDNRMTHVLGSKTTEFEAAPSLLKVPAMALAALRG